MARFILLRLLHTILILFGVSIVAFSLIHMIPGNPLDILLPPEARPPRRLLHIDVGEILEPALRADKAFDVLGHRARIKVVHDE